MLCFITRVGSSFKHGDSGLTSNKWESLAQQVYLRDYAGEKGFFHCLQDEHQQWERAGLSPSF